MSIWSSLSGWLRRAPQALPPPAPPPPPAPRVQSERRTNSGTPWSGWRPATERAPELQGKAWPATAREMLRTDPKLAGIYRMLTQALLSVRWEVRPGDGSEEAARNAEYVRHALGLEGRPSMLRRGTCFEAEVGRMLWFLPVGFRVLEDLYRIEGGVVWLDGWGDTEPESIREWRRDDTGRLVEIIQERVTGQPDPLPLPVGQALILTAAQTGDDYTGTGLLRSCWYWWRLKRHVLEQLGIGAERWATPSPLVTVDREDLQAAGYTMEHVRELMDRSDAAMEDYTSHEASTIRVPEGLRVTTFGEGAYDPSGLLAVIDRANEEMATAFVAQFVQVGMSGDSSRAVGEVHRDTWRQSLTNTHDYLAARVSGTTIDRLLSLNFYGLAGCPPSKRPALRHVGLEVDGLADALGTVPSLVAAGVLTPDDALERRVRRLIGLRDVPTPRREWGTRLESSRVTSDTSGGPGRPALPVGDGL